MAEEFENGFNLKTRQVFSVHTTPGEDKNATITSNFEFEFGENLGKEMARLSA